MQWNKGGMFIKIKSLFGRMINFEVVTAIVFENNILKITRRNDQKEEFDMNHILEGDRNKLLNYSGAFQGSVAIN